jgi:hypothetical protein
MRKRNTYGTLCPDGNANASRVHGEGSFFFFGDVFWISYKQDRSTTIK